MHWRPGYYWSYWWDNYPVLTAFGLTTWAINRVGWAFGYYGYSNPYYTGTVVVDNSVYDYSQPLVMAPDEQSLSADPSAPPPGVSQEALAAFDQARQAFYAGDYQAALTSTDAALKLMPNDAVIHEFRALVMFAQGKYQDAAAILYPVLSVGPGWDWTTLSGFYPSVDEYTKQLRAAEGALNSNPNDPALRFVLAYHYLTAGHEDAAAKQLETLLSINPKDQLAAQLLLQLNPEATIPSPPTKSQPPKPTSAIPADALQGAWVATRGGGTFTMTLNADKTYAWKYEAGGKSQEVTGVWGIDEAGVLALEMNDGGVLLAQLTLSSGKLDFYMLGDTQGEEPLQFSKK